MAECNQNPLGTPSALVHRRIREISRIENFSAQITDDIRRDGRHLRRGASARQMRWPNPPLPPVTIAAQPLSSIV